MGQWLQWLLWSLTVVSLAAQPLLEARIHIDGNTVLRQIDGRLWGTNLTNESRTADRTVHNDNFVAAAQQIGIRILRFPGGNNADGYDWKRHEMILPGGRKSWTGAITLAEIITFCRRIGAELSLTVNFGSGTPEDAADLVEYCNGPADSEWGRKRVEDGFPEPLNVRFFEIGNEINQPHQWYYSWTAEDPYKYFFGGSEERRGNYEASPNLDPIGKKGDVFKARGGDYQVYALRFPPVKNVDVFWAPTQEAAEQGQFEKWRQVDSLQPYDGNAKVFVLDSLNGKLFFGDNRHGFAPPQGSWFLVEYTTYNRPGFLDFARAMRQAPSSVPIQIGAVTVPFEGQKPIASLDSLRMIYQEMDFLVAHQYGAPFPVDRYDYRRQIPYQRTRGTSYGRIRRNQQILDSLGIEKRLGLAITEWNIFLDEAHWKINRTLEAAVLAAEFFVRILNSGEDFPVWFAEQFALGGVWLALYNNWTSFSIAPMGYVFQGFQPWKGKWLLQTQVESPEAQAYDRPLPYITAAAARSTSGDTVVVAIVNSSEVDSIRCMLDWNGPPFAQMIVHRLEGDSLWANNDGGDPYNVALQSSSGAFRSAITVAPHSVIFLELVRSVPSSVGKQRASDTPALSILPLDGERTYQVRIALEKPASVALELWDPLGRRIEQIIRKELSAGEHIFPLSVSPVASGSYWVVLRSEDAMVVQPILLR